MIGSVVAEKKTTTPPRKREGRSKMESINEFLRNNELIFGILMWLIGYLTGKDRLCWWKK
jgi:hypothetical protein